MITHNDQSSDQSFSISMPLGALLKDTCGVDTAIRIKGLTLDSRNVGRGDLFFAIPGINQDGRQFVKTALMQGASAVIYESKNLPEICTEMTQSERTIGVENLCDQISQIAAHFYDYPSQGMKVIGITGTNGKTTCAYLITQALNLLGEDCAIMGTIGIGRLNQLIETDHTTGDAISVQNHLKTMYDEGVTAVCMEVSSHGLDQGRISGVDIDIAVFTNLTQDHLDYHGNMQAYADAKQKLFKMQSLEYIVSNRDNVLGRKILNEASVKTTSYGLADANVCPEKLEINEQGISFELHLKDQRVEIKSPLLGQLNVPNILAAVATLLRLGYSLAQISNVISELRAPPGRMELFPSQYCGAPIVVDYSHTPDSLELALKSLRPHCQGKLWVVFGCGGDRDQKKRPLMGRIAMENADYIIVTDDNPRTEVPTVIVDHILEGIDRNDTKLEIIHDRKKAIISAIEQSESNDMILVAGKGHEKTQTIGKTKHFFSDRAVVKILQGNKQC